MNNLPVLSGLTKQEVLADRFILPPHPKRLTVAIAAYECSTYGLKFGGLGEAVYGMAKGLARQGHQVTVLLPKFSQLPSHITEQLQRVEKITLDHFPKSKTNEVFGLEREGISFRYLDASFEDGFGDDYVSSYYFVSGPDKIYEDNFCTNLKARMAYFSNQISSYLLQHREDFDIAVFHDWHAALALHLLAQRYFADWRERKIPASVFVIHNNNYGCQGVYDEREARSVGPLLDKGRKGLNVMVSALRIADKVVTVSPSFALEVQHRLLGSGIDRHMRNCASFDKLTGIVNGSNPDIWNPADNAVLRNWTDPVTGENIPLTFSPEDNLIEKKALIKEQLQKALEVYYPHQVKKFRIDVRDTELVLYVGRYSSFQKGIDQFMHILKAAHEKGAAFVTMGVGEDQRASELLDILESVAERLGNTWITRGKTGESLRMQLGDKEKGIPALGPLFRAAATYHVVPSSFEPCGLVQFEAWLFGSLVIGTSTGGLADTIHSDPSSFAFNGFSFPRFEDWESKEQNKAVYETTSRAIDYWRSLREDEKLELMAKVMKHAKVSSWTSAPQGLTPIEQYERVFFAALEASKQRPQNRLQIEI